MNSKDLPDDYRVLLKNCQLFYYEDTLQYSSSKILTNAWIDIINCKITNIGQFDSTVININEYNEVIDCNNQLVVPGLMDAHIHVAMLGESKNFLNLKSCKSIDEMQQLLKSHCEKYKEISWIIGVNWDQTYFGRYPNKDDLDAVCNDRPVFLWRACWHIGVANTVALQKANIFDRIKNNDEIIGGVIDVDNNNNPTGILKERAVELITAISSIKTDLELENFILEGLDICKEFGLTGVQTNDESSFHIYKKLEEEKRLPIRVFLTPNYSDLFKDTSCGGSLNIKPLSASILGGNDTRDIKLIYDRIKIFSDGSLGAETAAIRKVSSEKSNDDFTGVLIFQNDKLVEMMTKSKELGYRLEVHAIGDAAAEKVLDAFEESKIDPSDRPIITHCQVLGADLFEKMKRANCIANVQPSFVPTDMKWVQNRLSIQHQKYSYAWKSLMEYGIVVAGGSDAPIETASPLIGLYDAIYRRNKDNEVFRPEECLTFAESLWTYTCGAAIACNAENLLGNLKIGYLADMVVLDASVLEDNALLSSTTPIMTIINGSIVSKRSDRTVAVQKLEGPYMPGKNGLNLSRRKIGHFSCACLLKGKFCSDIYSKECDK